MHYFDSVPLWLIRLNLGLKVKFQDQILPLFDLILQGKEKGRLVMSCKANRSDLRR